MKSNPITNLALLAGAVRESSLKRLRLVPEGSENWRPVETAMSFADIAFHIKEADLWLFTKLRNSNQKSMKGAAHALEVSSTQQFENLIDELAALGDRRSALIEAMSIERLESLIPDDRYDRKVTVWWIIARGNLDHETHHRGQIASYLRLIEQG
ncbi:MAG: DinB family protein [candidate division Zixibacteria bacterium]